MYPFLKLNPACINPLFASQYEYVNIENIDRMSRMNPITSSSMILPTELTGHTLIYFKSGGYVSVTETPEEIFELTTKAQQEQAANMQEMFA